MSTCTRCGFYDAEPGRGLCRLCAGVPAGVPYVAVKEQPGVLIPAARRQVYREPGKPGTSQGLMPQVYVREPAPQPRRMSGPEKRQALELEALKHAGVVLDWWFETVKVKVGVERCWYTLDFVCALPDGGTWVIETKGKRWTDDARVKFMAAALAFPGWRWTLKRLIKGEWVTAYDRGPTITREAA